jgi:DNA-binding LytR/AlgR family response regulator
MKAIIADDEELLAEHLRLRLAALWPQLEIVGVAANGIEAKEMIEGLRPDIAFLDIRMPGLTGLDVVQTLSAPARRACRMVFVTAYDEFAIQAFEREAVDYLLKPVSDDRLRAAVERLQRAPDAASGSQPADILQRLQALLPEAVERLRWVRASVGNDVRMVAVDEVCFFQATDKYTAVFTRDAEHPRPHQPEAARPSRKHRGKPRPRPPLQADVVRISAARRSSVAGSSRSAA